MADDTGQVGQVRWRYAPSRLLRLLTLTTNCHLAQDVLLYFGTIAPPLTSSSWRVSPCRWRLLLMAFSVVWFVGVNRLRGISGGLLPW